MSMILDQIGLAAIDSSGYPRIYIAKIDDVDVTHPWGLFLMCDRGKDGTVQLGDYMELDDAQQALRAVYTGISNGVSISLEGMGLESVENNEP